MPIEEVCRLMVQHARQGRWVVRLKAGDPLVFAHANEEIACIPMIETAEAVSRLDEILGVPGLDAVYVGPADLSLTLGLTPRMDHDDQSFQDARLAIAKACMERGITAGIHASAALAPKHVEAGYRMITISSDVGSMATGAAQDLRSVKDVDASGQPVYR